MPTRTAKKRPTKTSPKAKRSAKAKKGTPKKKSLKAAPKKSQKAATKKKSPKAATKKKSPKAATKKKRLETTAKEGPKAAATKSARAAAPAPAAPPPSKAEAAALIDEAMAEASYGNLERAAELMLRAADADPTDWRLPNEAGVFYFRLERYGDALRCYDRALMTVPDDVSVRMNRALVFVLTGDDPAALAALQQVLEIDPIHAPAFFELGKLHQKAREYEAALQCFDTALAHETMGTFFNMSGAPPRNMRLVFLVMLNKARSYFALDRADEGTRQAQTLWEQFEDADALLKLARELAEQARSEEAARVVDVLLAAQPDHAEARELRTRL